jgi:hypothetical protein
MARFHTNALLATAFCGQKSAAWIGGRWARLLNLTALARCIAIEDGVPPEGVILATVQSEASRLFGSLDGDYSEGITLLPGILASQSAAQGERDGELDGRYAVDSGNSGPYFGRLRSRFGVHLPDAPAP